MSDTISRSTISVHFWNLSAYVGGTLIGDWIDLDDIEEFEDFEAKVKEITQGAEEVLLSTYENDYGINFGEYESLTTVWDVHKALGDLDESDRQAFGDYLDHVGGNAQLDYALSSFRDAYCGQWDCIEDYAWSYAEDAYPELANCPSGFRVEVDTIAWECDHWISNSGHVFRSL